jgi:hypothetical protein
MNLNSPIFDKVRIRHDEAEGETRSAGPTCQHPGCRLPGLHRAPMGRDREGQYLFFCLAHVQEYNKSYNYFAGMSDDAIAAFQKDAITGHRPTWTIGSQAETSGPGAPEGAPASDRFARARRWRTGAAPAEPSRRAYGKIALKALETMGLDESATPEAIRAKYKAWVKLLHPDANGGDRSREEKLREIIRAYNTLKAAGHASV